MDFGHRQDATWQLQSTSQVATPVPLAQQLSYNATFQALPVDVYLERATAIGSLCQSNGQPSDSLVPAQPFSIREFVGQVAHVSGSAIQRALDFGARALGLPAAGDATLESLSLQPIDAHRPEIDAHRLATWRDRRVRFRAALDDGGVWSFARFEVSADRARRREQQLQARLSTIAQSANGRAWASMLMSIESSLHKLGDGPGQDVGALIFDLQDDLHKIHNAI